MDAVWGVLGTLAAIALPLLLAHWLLAPRRRRRPPAPPPPTGPAREPGRGKMPR
ncbi:MAG: hypothetical protein JNM26_04850 [Ideonella sp.]|nr:hypothetical protein [Ideonella sp.]